MREALANALVNADYFQGWSVVIEHYPDRIVMANPGTIIPGKAQMLKGGISRPQIMMKLNYTERQVRNSIDSLKREGYIHHEGPAKGGKWVVDKEYIQ